MPADPAFVPTPRSVFLGQICDCLLLAEGVLTQRPGAAIQISVSNPGDVTLVLWSGASIVVNLSVGDSIYPYQVVSYTPGSATVSAAYNLFT